MLAYIFQNKFVQLHYVFLFTNDYTDYNFTMQLMFNENIIPSFCKVNANLISKL